MSVFTVPQNNSNSYLDLGNWSFDPGNGMPNSVREALLSQGMGDTALVLDALYSIGFKPGTTFTFKQAYRKLHDHGIKLADALLRRGLGAGVLVVGKLKQFLGRPSKLYHMPLLDDLITRFANGFWSATDMLQVEDLQSLKLYREAMHREFIKRRCGIYSRFFLSQRLGVGKRTTRNYEKRDKHYVVRRRVAAQSFKWLRMISNWEDLITSGQPGKNWLRVVFSDGRQTDMPLRLGIARRWLKLMQDSISQTIQIELFLMSQQANSYAYVDEPIFDLF